jgi:hypothetical protein
MLLVASTPNGDFLPFQQVWAGALDKSLPSLNVAWMEKATERSFNFAYAKSEKKTSYFSMMKIMKEVSNLCFESFWSLTAYSQWIENILVPYRQSIIETDDLDDDQMAIVYLDYYPVHRGVQLLCLGKAPVHNTLFCACKL